MNYIRSKFVRDDSYWKYRFMKNLLNQNMKNTMQKEMRRFLIEALVKKRKYRKKKY